MDLNKALQLIESKLTFWFRELIRLLPNLALAAVVLVLGLFLSKQVRRIARNVIGKLSHGAVITNLFASFVVSLLASRAIAFLLRDRHRVGPFRNVRVKNRHIHHFVPGIALAFASGAVAIVTRDENLEPRLALLFGTGMGMTMDEAALLLELDDVYWTEEGLLSFQIGFGLVGLLGALAIGLRFLRRGEAQLLPHENGPTLTP